MTKFEIQNHFEAIDHKAARAQINRVGGQRYGMFKISLPLMGVAILIGILIGLGGSIFQNTYLLYAMILIATAILVPIAMARTKKATDDKSSMKKHAGVTQVTLSEEGYAIKHPGVESLVRWSHVHGVTHTKDALLILNSPVEYYPIEASAIGGEAEMEELARKIEQWIVDAKSNPAAPRER